MAWCAGGWSICAQWIFEEFRVGIAKQTLSRELRAMGYRKLSARPRHHAQAEGAIEDFKKASPRAWNRSRARRAIEPARDRGLVCRRGPCRPEEQDHPALGQARHAPSAPHDQRTASTYIFGAICPKDGKGAALVLPACNTEAMNLHLAEIARRWRREPTPSSSSTRPDGTCPQDSSCRTNITLIPLPPKSPELNPVENIWQFMRDNWLSNRVFKSYDDILDHCCDAWNKLVDQPWRIMSIGLREWAHRF